MPAGANVAFLPFNMGRSCELYLEPMSFRPERWIPFKPPAQHEPLEWRLSRVNALRFPVFQAGPRVCLGMDMAIFEAKICVVELLRHLRFHMVPGQEVGKGE